MGKTEPLSNLLTIQQRDTACWLYQEGQNCPEIGREFGVTGASIRNLLKSRGIARRPPPTAPMYSEKQHQQICASYIAGKSTSQIAKELSVAIGTITNVLRRSSVKQRSGSERNRIYDCDHHFFDNIDSEAKAYWLGFFAADGYISKPDRSSGELILSLAIKDQEHLLRFKHALQATHPVREYDYSSRGKTNYPYASFSIRSEQLTRALARFGIVSRKCHTFEWPVLLSNLQHHFLRGYFDGDGCWNIKASYKNSEKMAQWNLDIAFRLTSDQRFLVGCREYLERTCHLNSTKLSHRYWKGEYSASTLIYSGRISASRIFNLMYDDASIWLPRKRDSAAAVITGEAQFLTQLRAIRLKQDLSRKQLSASSGVPISSIGTLENLYHRANWETAYKLATALKVDRSSLTNCSKRAAKPHLAFRHRKTLDAEG